MKATIFAAAVLLVFVGLTKVETQNSTSQGPVPHNLRLERRASSIATASRATTRA